MSEFHASSFLSTVRAFDYLLAQFYGSAAVQARGALTPAQNEALDILQTCMDLQRAVRK